MKKITQEKFLETLAAISEKADKLEGEVYRQSYAVGLLDVVECYTKIGMPDLTEDSLVKLLLSAALNKSLLGMALEEVDQKARRKVFSDVGQAFGVPA